MRRSTKPLLKSRQIRSHSTGPSLVRRSHILTSIVKYCDSENCRQNVFCFRNGEIEDFELPLRVISFSVCHRFNINTKNSTFLIRARRAGPQLSVSVFISDPKTRSNNLLAKSLCCRLTNVENEVSDPLGRRLPLLRSMSRYEHCPW